MQSRSSPSIGLATKLSKCRFSAYIESTRTAKHLQVQLTKSVNEIHICGERFAIFTMQTQSASAATRAVASRLDQMTTRWPFSDGFRRMRRQLLIYEISAPKMR